jgi:hypothetical protein
VKSTPLPISTMRRGDSGSISSRSNFELTTTTSQAATTRRR